MIRNNFILAAVVLAGAARVGAGPITLPSPTFDIGVASGPNGNGVCCANAATYTASGGYSLGGASASAIASPDLTGQASVIGLASANVTALYYFYVVGAQPGVPVNVIISGSLSVSGGGGDASTSAELNVDTSINVNSAEVTTGSWSGNLDVLYGAGFTAYVQIVLDATNGSSVGFANAFADPYIFIDPNQPNAANYSIVVSPGIGNVAPAAVPEPGTLALCGGGVLAVLYRLRRRKCEAL